MLPRRVSCLSHSSIRYVLWCAFLQTYFVWNISFGEPSLLYIFDKAGFAMTDLNFKWCVQPKTLKVNTALQSVFLMIIRQTLRSDHSFHRGSFLIYVLSVDTLSNRHQLPGNVVKSDLCTPTHHHGTTTFKLFAKRGHGIRQKWWLRSNIYTWNYWGDPPSPIFPFVQPALDFVLPPVRPCFRPFEWASMLVQNKNLLCPRRQCLGPKKQKQINAAIRLCKV